MRLSLLLAVPSLDDVEELAPDGAAHGHDGALDVHEGEALAILVQVGQVNPRVCAQKAGCKIRERHGFGSELVYG